MSKVVHRWKFDGSEFRLVEAERSYYHLEKLGQDAAGDDRWDKLGDSIVANILNREDRDLILVAGILSR